MAYQKTKMQDIALKNIRYQSWINFFAGAVFLVPIITLFYKYTGLGLFEIIIIANVSSIFVWILEIPTSVFADTMGRKRSLFYSVSANFLGALMILLFPLILRVMNICFINTVIMHIMMILLFQIQYMSHF